MADACTRVTVSQLICQRILLVNNTGALRVISGGGVVDIDALQMAWSQRLLSILLDTNASRLKGSNKGLGNGARARGGDGGAGLETL